RGERLAYLLWDQGRVIIDEQQMGHGWRAPGRSGLIREADAIVRSVGRTIQPKGVDAESRPGSSALPFGILFAPGMIGQNHSVFLPFRRTSGNIAGARPTAVAGGRAPAWATGPPRQALAAGRSTMSHPKQVRLAGSVLDRSRHVCAFFHRKEEEYRVLLPFIKEGF